MSPPGAPGDDAAARRADTGNPASGVPADAAPSDTAPTGDSGARSMEDELVAWGRVLRLETRGRVTGRTARATVGFVDGPGGSVLVAAGEHDAHWARNLRAFPLARVTIGERSFDVRARELSAPERVAAVRELILRYGTPAERLGSAPAFELIPHGG
jgi:deazaflavin-dependent oxidoreductase (nitroreductase family)